MPAHGVQLSASSRPFFSGGPRVDVLGLAVGTEHLHHLVPNGAVVHGGVQGEVRPAHLEADLVVPHPGETQIGVEAELVRGRRLGSRRDAAVGVEASFSFWTTSTLGLKAV